MSFDISSYSELNGALNNEKKNLFSDLSNILIVDDEESIRNLLSQALTEDPGIKKIYTTGDGFDAIEKIKQESFQVMLLDLIMPTMQGIEVLERVKKIDPKIQIIVITGNASISTAISSLRMGVYDYIQKPLDLMKLRIVVRNALEKYRLNEEKKLYLSSLQHSVALLKKHRDKLKHKMEVTHKELEIADWNLSEKLHELNILHQCGQIINSKFSIEDIIIGFCELIISEMDIEYCTVLIPDRDNGNFSLKYKSGFSDDFLQELLKEFSTNFVNTIKDRDYIKLTKIIKTHDSGCNSGPLYVIPFQQADNINGVFIYYKSYNENSSFTEDISLFITMRNMMSQAIDRALMIQDLVHLKHFNNSILTHMASGLMTLDRKGHITYINKTARNLLGIEISKYNDAIGKHYLDILNFIDGEDFIKKALFTHHSYASDVEALIETWNNKKIPLNLRTTHFLDQNGSSRGLIAIFEDLSKKKAIEEEIKKMDRLATLGQFVAHIVHEVKNPLSGIKTAAELVQERTLGEPRMSKLTNIILDEVERLVKLLKDLLNYARPSKLSVSKENVHAMLDKVLELMSRELSQKNISIIKNFHSEIHEIEADNDKLTSLFMNLILNGIQALDKDGEITITTNCCIYDLNDNYKGIDGIRVIISDNGHGIPDEKIKMITEPFVTTKSDGTGLGLSICQRIVDSHKGLMLFNSTPGKGTSVTVNLPLFQYRTLTSKRSIDHTV